MNPDLDLVLTRLIRAPRAAVWNAWTDPSHLEKWWVPAPAQSRVDRLEVRPGGGFVTRLSENGSDFVPHLDACFLAVDDLERIVFTNAIDSAWRPASPEPVAMTARSHSPTVPTVRTTGLLSGMAIPPPAHYTRSSASPTAGPRLPHSSPCLSKTALLGRRGIVRAGASCTGTPLTAEMAETIDAMVAGCRRVAVAPADAA